MAAELIVTHEVAPAPARRDDAHKGEVGRIAVIGGCDGEVMMIGAPALAANAALRCGAGLVQVFVPDAIRSSVAVLAPCATLRTLPTDADSLCGAIEDFQAEVVAVGPGLGRSLSPNTLCQLLTRFQGSMVVDADGLNLLAEAGRFDIPNPGRCVLTPHSGELHRLLAARGVDRTFDRSAPARRAAACALVEAYGCVAIHKGRGTVVTDGRRLFVNQTGNSGMATGGTGDVLTGVIAALLGQRMEPLEAAILGVYLHGLAGDFAAEELGRRSLTALDVIDYLPDAFAEHEGSAGG